jgi:hypothetical protein
LITKKIKAITRFILDELKAIKSEHGFSTQDVATGLTLAVIVTSVAVTVADATVLDTTEFAHVLNAKEISNVVQEIMSRDGVSLDYGEEKVFTLGDLDSHLKQVSDVSADDGSFYSKTKTIVIARNVVRADSTEHTIVEFFVKLVNTDDTFTYIDETDDLITAPVNSIDLSRDNVTIPERASTS